MRLLFFAIVLALVGCASMTPGWYKPGGSQQEFTEDKYECMSKSQMAVSGAYVNANGGAASSGTTTNEPLFQACMQARGYVWTNKAEVEKYEAQASGDQPLPNSSPSLNAYYKCMNRHQWDNSAKAGCDVEAAAAH